MVTDRQPQIELTDDGSLTLRSALNGDSYHSTRGAVGESLHVFIEAGFRQLDRTSIRVFEMGFGSGLNAWQTLQEAESTGCRVDYTAIELYPVPTEIAARLNYTADSRFMSLHQAAWNEKVEITPDFCLTKLQGDLTKTEISGNFDLIYYDAFAPDTQPELWTPDIFGRLYGMTADGGILVTYSSKGDVRRALQDAGYRVERLPGALGKRHMLRATKDTSI